MRYVFGSKNESQNRKGRLILMEDATGAQEFSYGVMGEIESIRRTVIVPNSAVATYVTSWKYDSWNRLQEMIYPDQEKISYTYNSGGLLQAVAGKKAYSYNYVNKIGYDKFEQRSYLKYCNGTETKYTYEPLRRRLDNMTVASGTGYQGTNTPRMFMNNKYQYDKVSNVLNVTNSAAGVTNKMGGIMAHNYSYDNLYQLTSANGVYTGADQKTANYNLEMKYDDLHNIVSKTQNVMQNKVTETGALKAGYVMNYNYNSTNKHQLDNVNETEYRTKNTDPKVDKQKNNKYVYDKNGNMIYVNTEEVKINGQIAEKAQEKKFIWDEENRLGAVDINGYVSNYTYDAGGERVTKLSGGGQGIFVNSVFAGGKTSTSDFTLYVNPYLVAQNGGRYTKHIYIGSQRIVSKLGDFDSYGADPRRLEKAGESFSGVKVNYDAKYKKSLDVVKSNYDTFEVPYYGNDNNDYVNGLGFCCNPSGETSSSSSSSTTGKLMAGKNDNAELQQFYYHPDHLGSSSYISNLDGEVVQHIEYVPFGEVFLEEKNAKWNTPYLFTSKELDRETGLYYFGARYQDPKLGIFISVDPLAEKFRGWSSYTYALNNPLKFIDPDGRSSKDWYKDKNGVTRFDRNVKNQADVDKISPGGKYIASEFNTETANYYKDGSAFFKNEHEGYQFMIDNSGMQKGPKLEIEHFGYITKNGVAVLPKAGKDMWDNDFENSSLRCEFDVKGYLWIGTGKNLTVNFQGKKIKPIAWIHTHPDTFGGYSSSAGDTRVTKMLGIPSIIIGRNSIFAQSVNDAKNNVGGGEVMTRNQLEKENYPIISNIKLLK